MTRSAAMQFSVALFVGGGEQRPPRPADPSPALPGAALAQRLLRAACALRPVELFVASPWLPGWPAPPAFVLPEVYPGHGPLEGLAQGLGAMSAPWLLALRPDIPWLAARHLPYLAAHCRRGLGVVPQWRHRPEPLAAFYPREAWPIARTFLAEGCYDLQHLAAWLAAVGLVRMLDVPAGERAKA